MSEKTKGDAKTELVLVSYNVWFSSRNQVARARALFEIMQAADADVICLQEVTPKFLAMLREEGWVKDSYMLSDSIGTTFRGSFAYGVMMLVHRCIDLEEFVLHSLPSQMNRSVLLASLRLGLRTLEVGTVHLESLDNPLVRELQLSMIFGLLSSENAVLLGDMNYDDRTETHTIPEGYMDCWSMLYPNSSGFTMQHDDVTSAPTRIDRIFLRSSELRPHSMRLLGTDGIGVCASVIEEGQGMCSVHADGEERPSDHYGLCMAVKCDEFG